MIVYLEKKIFDRDQYNIEYSINYTGLDKEKSLGLEKAIIKKFRNENINLKKIKVLIYEQPSTKFYHLDCRIWSNLSRRKKNYVSRELLNLFSVYFHGQKYKGALRIHSSGFWQSSSSRMFF